VDLSAAGAKVRLGNATYKTNLPCTAIYTQQMHKFSSWSVYTAKDKHRNIHKETPYRSQNRIKTYKTIKVRTIITT
jgi:hypothetical protein